MNFTDGAFSALKNEEILKSIEQDETLYTDNRADSVDYKRPSILFLVASEDRFDRQTADKMQLFVPALDNISTTHDSKRISMINHSFRLSVLTRSSLTDATQGQETTVSESMLEISPMHVNGRALS